MYSLPSTSTVIAPWAHANAILGSIRRLDELTPPGTTRAARRCSTSVRVKSMAVSEDQKLYFNASWISRAPVAPVICPADDTVTLATGFWNFGVLVRLNISARN